VTDKELDRNAARRLAIIRHAEEVTGNVAKTCRYYGVNLQYAGAVQTVTHLIVPDGCPDRRAALRHACSGTDERLPVSRVVPAAPGGRASASWPGRPPSRSMRARGHSSADRGSPIQPTGSASLLDRAAYRGQ
jgi:hypothetical protein